ncbi:MAG: hypothetical protein EZS28_026236 [Streblomastix strix]|uniref:Uncharacterized protein n=1 Tax=Streblomastix strix TaxID=222440 RepID=A0A5J4V6I2_9EUKA|nr:MAG: hypothetical protein EZS28_026236 [Streblomastix strix]
MSPRNSLQNLPEIPSFVVFSRSGRVIRSIPTFYDRIPMKDIFTTIHVLSMQNYSFNELWKCSQNKVLDDYIIAELESFRLNTIEQALREWIATGKIARRPPVPLTDYHPPTYSLRNGRYFESTPKLLIGKIQISRMYVQLFNNQ